MCNKNTTRIQKIMALTCPLQLTDINNIASKSDLLNYMEYIDIISHSLKSELSNLFPPICVTLLKIIRLKLPDKYRL